MKKVVILGAGISGLSAAYHLQRKGIQSIVFEKDSEWGGLCGCFTVGGFLFDRFPHISFTNNKYVRSFFKKSAFSYTLPMDYVNYWKGYWLKHPAQSNLYPLPVDEKVRIICDFAKRFQNASDVAETYADWCLRQFGLYFYEHFIRPYTQKYWGRELGSLTTSWIKNRVHTLQLEEVLEGAFQDQSKNFHYVQEQRYPKKGGFKSFLNLLANCSDIRCDKEVVEIFPNNRKILFSDGGEVFYDILISTLPLSEIVRKISICPKKILEASEQLRWTCGYQISLGFNRADIPKNTVVYIYDRNVLPSRVHSPSMLSPSNAPMDCSSLQAEVYWDCKAEMPNAETVLRRAIEDLKPIFHFTDQDIIAKDIRFEPYANIAFVSGTEKYRQYIRDYLYSLGIETIGRFGEWDYLWTDQSFLSGYNVCGRIGA